MSPELVAIQLRAGAWGASAASVYQVRFLASLGVKHVILALQVVDGPGVFALAEVLRDYPGTDVFAIVDTVRGAQQLAGHLRQAGISRRLPVLLEVGITGGRTGVRTREEALSVARTVRAEPVLCLMGVEAFEGIVPPGRESLHLDAVDEVMDRVAETAAELDGRGMFDEIGEIVISAGGSIYVDRVALLRRPDLSRPIRLVVRAGGTLTHDHGPLGAAGALSPSSLLSGEGLRAALELWAVVVSVPEPGIALAACGKRDAPFDVQLPIVLAALRDWRPIQSDLVDIFALNDQHAYVRHAGQLEVGDVLKLGPCHPCTAFDKWSLVPLLDDEDRVVGAITTHF